MKNHVSVARWERQSRIVAWIERTFGPQSMDKRERAERFLEEAIELAQACDITSERAFEIMAHVFAKPPGRPVQEIGNVSLTLLALGARLCTNVDDAERHELERVEALPREHWTARHDRKVDTGLAQP